MSDLDDPTLAKENDSDNVENFVTSVLTIGDEVEVKEKESDVAHTAAIKSASGDELALASNESSETIPKADLLQSERDTNNTNVRSKTHTDGKKGRKPRNILAHTRLRRKRQPEGIASGQILVNFQAIGEGNPCIKGHTAFLRVSETLTSVRHCIAGAFRETFERDFVFLNKHREVQRHLEWKVRLFDILPKTRLGRPEQGFKYNNVQYKRVTGETSSGMTETQYCAGIVFLYEAPRMSQWEPDELMNQLSHVTENCFAFIPDCITSWTGVNYAVQCTAVHSLAAMGATQLLTDAITTLLELQNISDLRDHRRACPLHYAAENGHLRTCNVILMLLGTEQLAVRDVNGRTPLHLAFQRGHWPVVGYLLHQVHGVFMADNTNCNVFNFLDSLSVSQKLCLMSHVNFEYLNPLMLLEFYTLAVRRRDITSIRTISRHIPAELVNVPIEWEMGWTVVHFAASLGDREVLQEILDKGGNPEKRSDSGIPYNTSSFSAETWQNGLSPLDICCRNGHASIVDLVITDQITIVDICVALREALRYKHLDVVAAIGALFPPLPIDFMTIAYYKYLLDHDFHNSASRLLQCQDSFGIIASRIISEAAVYGLDGLVSEVLSSEVEININLRDYMGRTPLHEAAQSGHTGVVDKLLTSGADPNLGDWRGSTALHYACSSGHIPVIDSLLKCKETNPNLRDSSGRTPLLMALHCKKFEVAEYMINLPDHNIDIGVSCRHGLTALHYISYLSLTTAEKLIQSISIAHDDTASPDAYANQKSDIVEETNYNGITASTNKECGSINNSSENNKNSTDWNETFDGNDNDGALRLYVWFPKIPTEEEEKTLIAKPAGETEVPLTKESSRGRVAKQWSLSRSRQDIAESQPPVHTAIASGNAKPDLLKALCQDRTCRQQVDSLERKAEHMAVDVLNFPGLEMCLQAWQLSSTELTTLLHRTILRAAVTVEETRSRLKIIELLLQQGANPSYRFLSESHLCSRCIGLIDCVLYPCMDKYKMSPLFGIRARVSATGHGQCIRCKQTAFELAAALDDDDAMVLLTSHQGYNLRDLALHTAVFLGNVTMASHLLSAVRKESASQLAEIDQTSDFGGINALLHRRTSILAAICVSEKPTSEMFRSLLLAFPSITLGQSVITRKSVVKLNTSLQEPNPFVVRLLHTCNASYYFEKGYFPRECVRETDGYPYCNPLVSLIKNAQRLNTSQKHGIDSLACEIIDARCFLGTVRVSKDESVHTVCNAFLPALKAELWQTAVRLLKNNAHGLITCLLSLTSDCIERKIHRDYLELCLSIVLSESCSDAHAGEIISQFATECAKANATGYLHAAIYNVVQTHTVDTNERRLLTSLSGKLSTIVPGVIAAKAKHMLNECWGPLVYSCLTGDYPIISMMLSAPIPPDVNDTIDRERGLALIDYAAMAGKEAVFEYLIDKGASISIITLIVCCAGHSLLNHSSPWSQQHKAQRLQSFPHPSDIFDPMIAKAETITEFREIQHSGRLAIARQILRRNGIDVNASDKHWHGLCPLESAVMSRHAGIVSLLLSQGADPQSQPDNQQRNNRVWIEAVRVGDDHIAELVLKHMIQNRIVGAATDIGQMLLDTVHAKRWTVMSLLLDCATQLEKTEKRNLIRLPNKRKGTILHAVSAHTDVRLVRRLTGILSEGGVLLSKHLEKKDPRGYSAMHYAAAYGQLDVLVHFLSLGAEMSLDVCFINTTLYQPSSCANPLTSMVAERIESCVEHSQERRTLVRMTRSIVSAVGQARSLQIPFLHAIILCEYNWITERVLKENCRQLVDTRNRDGGTSIDIAANIGRKDLVDRLLLMGAQSSVKTLLNCCAGPVSKSPTMGKDCGYQRIDMVRRREIERTYIASTILTHLHTESDNLKDSNWHDAFLFAAANGFTEIVRMIMTEVNDHIDLAPKKAILLSVKSREEDTAFAIMEQTLPHKCTSLMDLPFLMRLCDASPRLLVDVLDHIFQKSPRAVLLDESTLSNVLLHLILKSAAVSQIRVLSALKPLFRGSHSIDESLMQDALVVAACLAICNRHTDTLILLKDYGLSIKRIVDCDSPVMRMLLSILNPTVNEVARQNRKGHARKLHLRNVLFGACALGNQTIIKVAVPNANIPFSMFTECVFIAAAYGNIDAILHLQEDGRNMLVSLPESSEVSAYVKVDASSPFYTALNGGHGGVATILYQAYTKNEKSSLSPDDILQLAAYWGMSNLADLVITSAGTHHLLKSDKHGILPFSKALAMGHWKIAWSLLYYPTMSESIDESMTVVGWFRSAMQERSTLRTDSPQLVRTHMRKRELSLENVIASGNDIAAQCMLQAANRSLLHLGFDRVKRIFRQASKYGCSRAISTMLQGFHDWGVDTDQFMTDLFSGTDSTSPIATALINCQEECYSQFLCYQHALPWRGVAGETLAHILVRSMNQKFIETHLHQLLDKIGATEEERLSVAVYCAALGLHEVSPMLNTKNRVSQKHLEQHRDEADFLCLDCLLDMAIGWSKLYQKGTMISPARELDYRNSSKYDDTMVVTRMAPRRYRHDNPKTNLHVLSRILTWSILTNDKSRLPGAVMSAMGYRGTFDRAVALVCSAAFTRQSVIFGIEECLKQGYQTAARLLVRHLQPANRTGEVYRSLAFLAASLDRKNFLEDIFDNTTFEGDELFRTNTSSSESDYAYSLAEIALAFGNTDLAAALSRRREGQFTSDTTCLADLRESLPRIVQWIISCKHLGDESHINSLLCMYDRVNDSDTWLACSLSENVTAFSQDIVKASKGHLLPKSIRFPGSDSQCDIDIVVDSFYQHPCLTSRTPDIVEATIGSCVLPDILSLCHRYITPSPSRLVIKCASDQGDSELQITDINCATITVRFMSNTDGAVEVVPIKQWRDLTVAQWRLRFEANDLPSYQTRITDAFAETYKNGPAPIITVNWESFASALDSSVSPMTRLDDLVRHSMESLISTFQECRDRLDEIMIIYGEMYVKQLEQTLLSRISHIELQCVDMLPESEFLTSELVRRKQSFTWFCTPDYEFDRLALPWTRFVNLMLSACINLQPAIFVFSKGMPSPDAQIHIDLASFEKLCAFGDILDLFRNQIPKTMELIASEYMAKNEDSSIASIDSLHIRNVDRKEKISVSVYAAKCHVDFYLEKRTDGCVDCHAPSYSTDSEAKD